jgi:uncharacterized protein (TIGR02453 family)
MFSPRAFTFLRQLKKNNNREWFQSHKPDFEAHLLTPLRELVEEMDVRLAGFAPEIGGSPKRSIFRIYRDVRFSKDKSPYKTNMGCWFTHVRAGHGVGSETHGAGAGFYFHLEPGSCFAAAGIWMPPRDALAKIRGAIAEDHKTLRKILGAPAFTRRFGTLSEEKMLTRVPKPWDKDHPAGDLLRRSSFTVSTQIPGENIASTRLPSVLEGHYKAALLLVRWLNSALGHAPMTRR